jgi:hypothetical protein
VVAAYASSACAVDGGLGVAGQRLRRRPRRDRQQVLLPPAGPGPRGPLAGYAGQRFALPERDRLPQRRYGRIRLLHQPAEPVQVDAVRLDREHVAAGAPRQGGPVRVTGQRGADAGEVGVQRVPGAGRRVHAPDPLDQRLGGHHPARLDEQRGQHRPALRPPQLDRPGRPQHLDRTQHPELHRHRLLARGYLPEPDPAGHPTRGRHRRRRPGMIRVEA